MSTHVPRYRIGPPAPSFESLAAQDLERQIVTQIVGSAEELAEEVQDARAEPGMAEAPAVLAAHLHAQEAKDGAERLLTIT